MNIVGRKNRMVNEPLGITSLNSSYEGFKFKCDLCKNYSNERNLIFKFTFSDGSCLIYNRTNQTINRIKDYGQANKFTLEHANSIYQNRLKRIMFNSR